MCKFYSALVKKNGDLLHDPHLTSHEDLIDLFGLNDNGKQVFCRVEYSPKDNEWGDIDSYRLEIDERETPDWFTKSMQENITDKLHRIVKSRIIKGEKRKILTGGYYILIDSEIDKLQDVVIYHMQNSTVRNMCGNSTVNYMRDNSTVNYMRDNSTVNYMRDNSTVNDMWDNSTVNYMRDNSTVNYMWDNSTVNDMRDNSTVNDMWDNSTVNDMRGNSTVKNMRDNSTVKNKNKS